MDMRLYVPRNNGVSLNQGGGGQLRLANSDDAWEEELRRRMAAARQQGWNEEEITRSAMLERGVRTAQQRREAQEQQQAQAQAPKKAGRAGGIKGFALDITPFGRVAEKIINPEAGDITAGEIGMEALLTATPFALGKVFKGAKVAKGAITGTKAVADTAKTKGLSRALLRNSTVAPSSTLKTASDQQKLIELTKSIPALRGSGQRKFQNVDNVIGGMSSEVDDLFKGVDSRVATPDFLSSINKVRNEIVDPNELKRFDIEVSRAMQGAFGDRAPSLTGSNARNIKVGDQTYQLVDDARNQSLRNLRVAQDANGAYKMIMANPTDGMPKIIDNMAAESGDLEKIFGFAPKGDKQVLDSFTKYGGQGTAKSFADTPDDLFGGPLQDLSATDINALRRQVNGQMSGIYRKIDAGTTLTDKDQAFLRVKEALDSQLTGLAPEAVRGQVQTLNRNMNTLMQARPEFKRLAEQRTQPLGLNLPIVSSAIPQAIQGAADITGRTLAKPLIRTAGNQAGVRLGAEAMGFRNNFKPDDPLQGQDQNMTLEPEALFADPQSEDEMILNEMFAGGGLTDFDSAAQGLADYQNFGSGMGMDGGNAGGLQYSSTQLFNAAMEALMAGDAASYKQLAGAAEQAAAMEKQMASIQKTQGGAAGSGPNITKVTAQQYGLAQSGANSLTQLKQLLQQDPNVLTASMTPGRKLPIVGGFISNAAGTGEFDAIGYNIADSLLRLRTGATANEGEVRNLQSQIMPRAGDSQATIARKFQQLEEAFSGVLQTASGPGGGNDFEEELMMMLGSSGSPYASAYGY